jgi:hypothetical protein
MAKLRNGKMETWRHGHGEIRRKIEAQALFLNLITVCSSCKGKLIFCPFVDEETNGSYPLANGLNGLARQWVKGGNL